MPFKAGKIKAIRTDSLKSLGDSTIDLAKYTEDEFAQVASALQQDDPFTVHYVAPSKPRMGMFVYADGTRWNPGNGEGFYYYSSGAAWVPVRATTILELANTFTNTTESTSHSTGAQIFAGGIGVAKTISTGETLLNDGSVTNFPSIDVSPTGYVLASGATLQLANGASGFLCAVDQLTTGSSAIFVLGGGGVALLGQSLGALWAATSTPSASQIGVFFDGVATRYTIKNGFAVSKTISLFFARVRPSV